jgi:hypothetical protein
MRDIAKAVEPPEYPASFEKKYRNAASVLRALAQETLVAVTPKPVSA